MNFNPHNRAEVLAGAIALGEATDEERIEYRRHLAECGACLQSFGGEHELGRLAAAVHDARTSEIWEPDVRGPLMDRMSSAPRRIARYGLGFLGVCLAISLIGHFIIGSTFGPRATLADPLVLHYDGTKIVLERRSQRDAKVPVPAPQRMIVTHNVVHMMRPAVASVPVRPAVVASHTSKSAIRERAVPAAPAQAVSQSETQTVYAISPTGSSIPPWRTKPQPVAHNAVAAGIASTNVGTAHAESIQISATYSTREAAPEGGETAINPVPAQIAYQQGAEGTTAFEVTIDENGNPTKCVITKPAGYPVLDDAVCRAAMKIKYRPKTLNGHPVPGVYRDAFTFRPYPNQE